MRPEELGVLSLPLIVWDLEFFLVPLPLEDLLGVWGLRIFSRCSTLPPLYVLGVWGLVIFFSFFPLYPLLFFPYYVFPYVCRRPLV